MKKKKNLKILKEEKVKKKATNFESSTRRE